MRLAVYLLLLLGAGCCCPPPCDCKWKSGKESAICVKGNLSTIPAQLDSSLQLLDLTANPISTIGKDAFSDSGLLNLQRVYLAKCRIRNLNRFAFRRLSNLVELDLSYNLISAVPSHVFDSISELRELKLSGNPIQRVSNDAFVNVPQLVKLELSECRVATLESKAFAGLEDSLEWLKLDNNRMVEVKPNALTGLRNLHGLELAGNPWNCSCGIRPLKLWMSDKNIPFSVPASCRDPQRLSGKTWDRLEESEFACPPGISPVSPGVTATEGTNVTMSCSVTGNPSPSVRWLWKNRPIANLSGLPSHKKMYILHYNGSRSSLTIYAAELLDAGVYFCVAANKAGKAQSNVTLSIARRKPESKLSTKVLGIGAAVAFVFLFLSCFLFCFLGQTRKEPRINQADNYEKIEMDKKSETCFSEIQPSNKVHPTMCEYRGVPSAEEGEDETSQSSLLLKSNASVTSGNWIRQQCSSTEEVIRQEFAAKREAVRSRPKNKRKSSDIRELSGSDLNGVQQHILRKEVLPTTSLYTTATPEDSRNYPDLVTTPPPQLPLCAATLPRSKNWYPRVSSSQSPLLASSRCGSSTGESSVSNSRRYSVESRASSYYSRNGGRRCERSASSLELFEADPVSWHHPSLPTSPMRQRPTTHRSPVSETPILNLLGSAVYDFHAAQLERFLDEYRTLQEELNRMKETCEGLREARKENASSDLYSLYSDIYRT